jgi:hypothetical protein
MLRSGQLTLRFIVPSRLGTSIMAESSHKCMDERHYPGRAKIPHRFLAKKGSIVGNDSTIRCGVNYECGEFAKRHSDGSIIRSQGDGCNFNSR